MSLPPGPHDQNRRAPMSPIARFLGPAAASGGPFALLGISVDQCTEPLVLAALDRQLDRLARHPEMDTPEADEVRLALHAAAAQLLDPSTRPLLLARAKQGKAPSAGATSISPPINAGTTTSASTPTTTSPIPRPTSSTTTPAYAPVSSSSSATFDRPAHRLEQDVLMTLAAMGGWNRYSLERVMGRARLTGHTTEDVLRVLAKFGRGPASTSAIRDTHDHEAARSSPQAATENQRSGIRRSISERPTSAGLDPSPTVQTPTHASAAESMTTRGSASIPAKAALPSSRWNVPNLPPRNRAEIEEADPGTAILRNALLIVGALVVGIGVSLGILLMLLDRSDPPAPIVETPPADATAQNDKPAGPDHSTTKAGGTNDAQPPQPQPKLTAATGDIEQSAARLREASAMVDANPEAATEALAQEAQIIGSQWPKLTRDKLVAVNSEVIGLMLRLSDHPSVGARVMNAVLQLSQPLGRSSPTPVTASAIAPIVWSTGLLARLTNEPELPASTRGSITSHLSGTLGQARPTVESTFDAGAIAAVYALPVALTPPPTESPKPAAHDAIAWAAWGDAVDALLREDGPQRSRVLLSGLEHLLATGPDAGVDAGVRRTVADLVKRLTWREEDESRAWLIRALDDARFTSGDLQALTSTLAVASSAKGVDTSMVLSADATEQDRQDLQDRYAKAWGIQAAVERSELARSIISASEDWLRRSESAGSPAQDLAATVALSRVSEAAGRLWLGQREETIFILKTLNEDLDKILERAPSEAGGDSVLGGGGDDGEWARRYKAVGSNLTQRQDLLETLARRGSQGLGPADAEVLVGEAFLGSPPDLRSRANSLVSVMSNSPPVVNAALELLPRLSPNPPNSRLIELLSDTRLPSPRDPRWPLLARRALVERLLQVVAAGSESASLDQLARLLQISYRGRTESSPLSQMQREEAKQPDARISGAALWSSWRRRADTLIPRSYAGKSIDQLERARSGRLGLATGLVESFAAEQVSLCEMMAYVIAAEHPRRAPEILEWMQQLNERRRRATHILDQIKAVEATMTRLWMVRIEERPTT